MDAITLDRLLAEIEPLVRGRQVRRVRSAGAQAVLLEVERNVLWLDVGRESAGVYLLDRATAERLRPWAPGDADAGSRQALLHLRKHVEGRRLSNLQRIAGTRVVTFDVPPATLQLRLARPAVLTLATDGTPLAAFGGEPDGPPPSADAMRAWTRLTAEAVRTAAGSGEHATRALLDACPELGPSVAQRLARDPGAWAALREELGRPRPLVVVPGPLDALTDADLAAPGSVALWPCPLDAATRFVVEASSWSEAARTVLELRLRGARFAARRRPLLSAAGARVRRAEQLERHLVADLDGLADEAWLRRQGEALLASGRSDAPGETIEVADPYEPGTVLRIRVDPRRTLPANADRLFEKARRMERARVQVAERLAQARAQLQAARAHEERVRSAVGFDALPALESGQGRPGADQAAPRRFLTSRGLLLLVGRGARENHELTFKVARPEDYWLHARDVPGAHVILRDPERRAVPEDLREAAEVAAFYSGARDGAQVDVHAARRKHVRPAGGGPGRVRVGHSETLRVPPRDPEGRLRRR
jgi:hypothetical protein